ncbi:MAG: hypothetical protein IPL35_15395 [Sphingobacteriales bacterium]|nr:hypothetical protein [Sphingobacteriales bacterium]
MYAAHAYYTTCSYEEPHFKITTEKVKVIPKKTIVSGPANLVIQNVPTPLILPFGIFPITQGRASGILMPAYGESPSLGFFLKDGGLYTGLGKHADLALRGDIYSRGSWGLNLASQYKKRYRFDGRLSVRYGKLKQGDPLEENYQESKDFFITWTHNQDAKAHPSRRFSANVRAGSKSYNRNFVNTTNNFLTNTFNSSIAYNKTFEGTPFSLTANATHSQNTQNGNIDITLPEINLNMLRQTPFKRKKVVGASKWYEKIGIGYTMNARNTVSTVDSLLLTTETLQKMRNGVKHQIPVSTNLQLFNYISISPNFNYEEYWYLQNIRKKWDNSIFYDTTYNAKNEISNIDTIYGKIVTDTLQNFKAVRQFSASVSANTRLYGLFQFKKGTIKAIRHVFTPTVSFALRPNFGSEFWGYYDEIQGDNSGTALRYSIFEQGLYGTPPDGRSGNLSFNIDNNFEMKLKPSAKDTAAGDRKIKLLESLSLSGAGYDFARDSLNWNAFAINARSNLFNKFNVAAAVRYDPYQLNEQGKRINRLLWEAEGRVARLTSVNFSIGTTLSSASKGEKKRKNLNGSPEEHEEVVQRPQNYVDFTIPWDITFNYNFYLNKVYNIKTKSDSSIITQTFNMNSSLQITPRWKVDVLTGFDFTTKDLSYTSITLFRDLHCWEASFVWVPNGDRRYYFFTLRVKSAMLQDLKLQRRRDWYDLD